ncbi:MAG: hypothetical protein L3J16_05835 [Anaerolineales bacterium]|nr:hypothetical protein [Anaerolineales bacterium]
MKKHLIAVIAVLLFASLACSVFSGPVATNEAPAPAPAQPNTDGPAPDQNEVPAATDNTIRTDDFSDPNSGWPDATTDGGRANYQDGSYRVDVTTEQMDIWAHPGWNMPNNLSVSVDATLISGSIDNDYGLLCRYNRGDVNDEYYFFVISSDGYAGIGLASGGETKVLSGENLEPVGEIKQGKATNTIRADCVGSQLTLYVNGKQVLSASDSTLKSGDVGVIAGTFAEPNTSIMFDNLAVSNP